MCGRGSILSLTSPFSFPSFVEFVEFAEFVEVISILYIHSKRQKDYILIGWSLASPLFDLECKDDVLGVIVYGRAFVNDFKTSLFLKAEIKEAQKALLSVRPSEQTTTTVA